MLVEQDQNLDSAIRNAVAFHGHLGPFLVLGVRMGLIGLRELKTSRNKDDLILRATAFLKQTPPFSCTLDGIQITTHCTVGNGRLKLKNKPDVISVVFGAISGKQVVVTLKPEKFEELKRALPKNRQSYTNIRLARKIASTPEKELFMIKSKRTLFHTDLKFAKQRLIQENLSLVIAKYGRVLFETEAHGLIGLLEAIKKLGNNIDGASVADRVVGRAAALLLAYSGVVSVFAVTIRNSGIEVLKKQEIPYEYDKKVQNILNLRKTDVCPFEKLVAELLNPKEAYKELKAHCTPK